MYRYPNDNTVDPTYSEPLYNEIPPIVNFFPGPLNFPMLSCVKNPAFNEIPPIVNFFRPLYTFLPVYSEF